MAKSKNAQLKDLKPDLQNRRRHTPRNIEMLAEALHRVGAARSIVIDEDMAILAGEGVTEAAARVGITKVKIVDAAGDEIVAVRRSGLSPEEKRQLAMYDNRVGELAEWNADQIAADVEAGLDMKPFFDEKELGRIVKTGDVEAVVKEVDVSEVADRFWISMRGPLQHQALVLQRMRTATADLEGVEVELGTIELEQWKPVGV